MSLPTFLKSVGRKSKELLRASVAMLHCVHGRLVAWFDRDNSERNHFIWKHNLNLVRVGDEIYTLPQEIHARRAEYFYTEHFVGLKVYGKCYLQEKKTAEDFLMELGAVKLGWAHEFLQEL